MQKGERLPELFYYPGHRPLRPEPGLRAHPNGPAGREEQNKSTAGWSSFFADYSQDRHPLFAVKSFHPGQHTAFFGGLRLRPVQSGGPGDALRPDVSDVDDDGHPSFFDRIGVGADYSTPL